MVFKITYLKLIVSTQLKITWPKPDNYYYLFNLLIAQFIYNNDDDDDNNHDYIEYNNRHYKKKEWTTTKYTTFSLVVNIISSIWSVASFQESNVNNKKKKQKT